MDKSKSTKGCEHPQRLKGKPGECSPEQIKECHGEAAGHSCTEGEQPSHGFEEDKDTRNSVRTQARALLMAASRLPL